MEKKESEREGEMERLGWEWEEGERERQRGYTCIFSINVSQTWLKFSEC